ncbi:MAG: CRISPR-associated endonuclease Cas6 [Methanobrevibacter sp.]|nr:CRISPR-associated endonuclease Cas6 [Candidatus Methanovirga procula]
MKTILNTKGIDGWKDKKLFLNNILVANSISMAKGLEIIVNL